MEIFTVFEDTDPDRLVATRTPCRQCKRQQTRRIGRDVWRLPRWYDLNPPLRHWPWRYCWSDIRHLFEPVE